MAEVPERARKLVERLTPVCICDACVAARLALDREAEVPLQLHALAAAPGFEWLQGRRALRAEDRKAIRHRPG